MIHLTKGNIFDADVEALVNTINTVGIMGKGVALQFKKAFPDNFKSYKNACDKNDVRVGQMFVFQTHTFNNPKYIINFPTKKHWRANSKMEYIAAGLDDLTRIIADLNIKSIAVPPLGSGLGGLNWTEVREKIFEKLGSLNGVDIFVYQPSGAPQPAKIIDKTLKPNMTFGRAAIIELMQRYKIPLYDYRLSLLEIHKLAYLLQESGLNLRLDFAKGSYGPYADNLRHVLNRIEGHFILGVGDGKTSPDTPVDILPGIAEQASAFLEAYSEVQTALTKVSNLIEGFETPYGMELLTSVHWISKYENAKNDLSEVLAKLYSWNERKRELMKRSHVEYALLQLEKQGWI